MMGATAVGTGINAYPHSIKQVIKHLADISGLSLTGAEDTKYGYLYRSFICTKIMQGEHVQNGK